MLRSIDIFQIILNFCYFTISLVSEDAKKVRKANHSVYLFLYHLPQTATKAISSIIV